MALPFLSGATGNPINLKRRVAEQASRGIPAAEADYEDFRSNGGPLAIEPQEIERLVIAQGGQPASRLVGKMNLGGGPFQIGDVDPANMGYLHFLANLFGQYVVTDNTSWQEWEFSLDLSTPTSASEFLSMLNDNDVLPRTRIFDMMMGAFRVSAASNENLACEFDFVAGEVDMWGAVTQESGTGSTLPMFKRLSDENWVTDATLATAGDMYVTLDVDNSGGNWDFTVKRGSGSAYSNSQTEDIEGRWVRLQDEAGDRVGLSPSPIAEQMLMYFPTGMTATGTDEFKVEGRRTAWSPSLAVDRPISSVNTIFILDGEEVRTEGGWNVEVAWSTVESVADVAGRQGATTQRSGELSCIITPTRRVVDLTLQEKLFKAETISVVIDANADAEVGASGRPFRQLIICPECKVFGTGYGVEAGGENREETLTLTAQAPATTPFTGYEDKSVSGHVNVIVENDVTSL